MSWGADFEKRLAAFNNGDRCPSVDSKPRDWCINFDEPPPYPADRVRLIAQSLEDELNCERLKEEREKTLCPALALMKIRHPLSPDVMSIFYSYVLRGSPSDEWRSVFFGLNNDYFALIFERIQRTAIDSAQSFAGVKFHDRAFETGRRALALKGYPDISLKLNGTEGIYTGQTRPNGSKKIPHGLGAFKAKGLHIAGEFCNGIPKGFSLQREVSFGMGFSGTFAGIIGPDNRFLWSSSETGIHPLSPYFGGFVGYLSMHDDDGPVKPVNWWNRKVPENELRLIPDDHRGEALLQLADCAG